MAMGIAIVLSIVVVIVITTVVIGFLIIRNMNKNYYIDSDDEKYDIKFENQVLKNVKRLVLKPTDLQDTKKIQLLHSKMEFVENEEEYDQTFDIPTSITMEIVNKTVPESCETYHVFNPDRKKCELDLKQIGSLMAHYTADSWDQQNNKWKDLSGKNNDAEIEILEAGANGIKSGNLIKGSTKTKVVFLRDKFPSTFTLFTVSKYDGTTKGRIFNGYPQNWLFGHWKNQSGVAYYEKWMTPQVNLHQDNLIVSAGTKNLYRSNGTQRSTETGGVSPRTVAINGGQYMPTEASDWAVGEVIIYDEELDEQKIKLVEEYLADKYGTPLARTTFQNTDYNRNYSIL